MDIYTLTIGQAIDYRRYSIGTMRWEWHHGHIVDIDTDPYQPLVFIDATIYDYRPEHEAVEPEKLRPTTTDCTTQAICQEARKL